MIPYRPNSPWHVQIHRDAFSYGDVGPKADPRVVVDLRFFGKSDICEDNRVSFGDNPAPTGWEAGVTDIYGMPQATVSYFFSIPNEIITDKGV
jgi:pyranose oxidase